jgi:hypothetical protein
VSLFCGTHGSARLLCVCCHQRQLWGLCNSPINVNPEEGEHGDFDIFQKNVNIHTLGTMVFI